LGFAFAEKITIINQRFVHYRFNISTSQTARKSNWPESSYRAMLFLKEKLIANGIYEIYKVGYIKKALSYVLYYLETMDNINSFRKLFYDLKNEYLDKLGVFDISDGMFMNDRLVRKRDVIREGEVEDYLFIYRENRVEGVRSQNILRGMLYTEIIPEGVKIALYGAGKLGKCVFANLIFEKRRKVCVWVDRDYEEIGYPVQSPDVLKDIDFDICFIAIENFEVYEEVREALLFKSIPEEKILWIMTGK